MIEIIAVDKDADYREACELLHRSQKAESEETGVLFNTIGMQPEQLKAEIGSTSGICLCAFENNKMVGTLCVFPDEKEKWYSGGTACKVIKYVAVSPDFQGKHIGTKMLDFVKSMPDCRILTVSTGEKNKNAIGFYEKNGFILVDVSRGPIHNAYKMAFWKDGCPIKQKVIQRHVQVAKMKCFLKRMIARPKAKPYDFYPQGS